MNEIEFQILDELYFVTSFKELKDTTMLSTDLLRVELISLLKKEWVKLYESDRVTEIDYVTEKFQSNFNSYCYLATKEGLFKHNSN